MYGQPYPVFRSPAAMPVMVAMKSGADGGIARPRARQQRHLEVRQRVDPAVAVAQAVAQRRSAVEQRLAVADREQRRHHAPCSASSSGQNRSASPSSTSAR